MAAYNPPPTTPAGPSGPRADFWRRFVALFLDGVLTGLIGSVLRTLLGRNVGGALALVAGVAYYVYLEGSPSGQTVGKRTLNIRVIDFTTGGPLGPARALIRWVGRILSTIPCLLGYFWALWDKERQTWHDKVAGTVVVPTSAYPVSAWPG